MYIGFPHFLHHEHQTGQGAFSFPQPNPLSMRVPSLIRAAASVLVAALAPCSVLAQALSATLTASDYNGYHISCFGKQDGSITAAGTGGTPPYSYEWTTGDMVATISGLDVGYYRVAVKDATGEVVEVDITLVQPTLMKVEAHPHVYPNGYNISLYNVYNGSIDVVVAHGVAPYSYTWSDGATTQDRTGLGDGTYEVTVADANGCESINTSVYLTQPERSDWTMSGNTGSTPGTHYIGTADAKDVVFKSNGVERLRLKSNGDISLLGNFPGEGPLFRMEDGTLRGGGALVDYPELPPNRCRTLASFPYWETRGNAFSQLCVGEDPVLGTLNNMPLKIVTNGVQQIHVAVSGRVGIGTVPPVGTVTGYRLFVEDGIATRDVLVKLGAWPDYVFKDDYHLLSLTELKDYLHTNQHLPGIPSAAEVADKGGVEVGDLQRRMLETIEQQALYILQLEERMKGMEQRMVTLEASK